MHKIRVRLKERSYDIIVGKGILRRSGVFLSNLDIGKDAVVITNRLLQKLYGRLLESSFKKAGLTVRFELVPDSEKAKSDNVVSRLLNKISAYDTHKRIFIVALGGGVIGDVAGFVASVYKRGIPYVQVPTTLLAQVDSAIGGKVAIDLPAAKNLVGAFYQPKIVLSDTSLLKTLPKRQLKSGLAEIIKYGIIRDKRLFKFLEKNYKKILRVDSSAIEYVVVSSCRIKARLVSNDEFDRTGIRAALNFGHTIGHAIEAACGYSDRYNHGEAVAAGMIIASRMSVAIGAMAPGGADRIENLIRISGLPARIKGLAVKRIYSSHLHDKKFIHGKNRFVLPLRIGKVRIFEDIPDLIIKNTLRTHLIND